MSAIGIDFCEYASYVWLDRANPTLHMRKVRWNNIQAEEEA